MAVVWVARLRGKHGFEKLVTIKTILPQYADDLAFQTMFLDEARIAARIRHPNVVEIFDLGEQNGVLYLVMEWIDGDSLSKLYNSVIRSGQSFPVTILLRILADACSGLHAAHELQDAAGQLLHVVHRDVSPQNLLISINGAIKVIDFGVAKARDRMSQETSAGLIKGKIQYTSPEQALGHTIDRRTDIWSLGTIMYFLLAGRFPFEADNELATLHLLTSGRFAAPLPSHVPHELQAIVRRALHPNLEERFETAAEMQRALEGALPQPTTSQHVALFLHEHMGSVLEGRRLNISAALAQATERSKVHALAEVGVSTHDAPPARDGSYSGVRDTGVGAESDSLRSELARFAATTALSDRGSTFDVLAAPSSKTPFFQARLQAWAFFTPKPHHWILLAVAFLVPVAVWVLVISTLLSSSKTPAPAAAASIAAPVTSANSEAPRDTGTQMQSADGEKHDMAAEAHGAAPAESASPPPPSPADSEALEPPNRVGGPSTKTPGGTKGATVPKPASEKRTGKKKNYVDDGF